MSEYKTDEEKAEELKAWWKENGTSVVVGVALAIAALFGWDYWKKYQIESTEAASTLYNESQTATDTTAAAKSMLDLQSSYPGSPYATLASLESAKTYAEQGEYDSAADALRWVLDNSKEQELKDVASLRLARVLVAAGKHDEAMKMVESGLGTAFESLLEELKGDIYAAQNKPDDARKAYDRAILTNKSGSTDLIKMKLDNLGKGA